MNQDVVSAGVEADRLCLFVWLLKVTGPLGPPEAPQVKPYCSLGTSGVILASKVTTMG